MSGYTMRTRRVAASERITGWLVTHSLHVIGSQNLGGAERFYLRLLPALAAAGEHVHACHSPHSDLAHDLPAAIKRTPVAMRGVWDIASRWRIRRLVRELDVDIVQTYIGRATRLTRLPLGPRPVHIARLGGYYNLKGYRHAHAWIGNTRGLCDYLLAQGVPSDRVFHIGNFVEPAEPADAARIGELRRTHAVPADALLLLAVGRLHPVKGLDDLLSAFARLPDTLHGRPLILAIVGDGPLRVKLTEQSVQLGLAERVIHTGWEREPAPWYDMADLVVVPSREETLGNVILEAWAHQRAVLSTTTPGGRELIDDGDNGVLTPIGDIEQLSAKLSELLLDDAARTQLAASGGNTLRANFSESAIVSGYQDLYRTLLANVY
ncbi:MAG: glycosyltransferase involved in cell wall biosynthesis [Gammaproteobacteria bacterium]|jgi:glycosyltransferase involved in cell wall biosynthesis